MVRRGLRLALPPFISVERSAGPGHTANPPPPLPGERANGPRLVGRNDEPGTMEVPAVSAVETRPSTDSIATGRALPSPGVLNVDWEESWNVDRLRTYRLGRTREVHAACDVGVGPHFDYNNLCVLSHSL